MTTTSIETETPKPVRSTRWLDELEAELVRQKDFVRWLHNITALPHIIGGAERELAKLQATVESERVSSSNAPLELQAERKKGDE